MKMRVNNNWLGKVLFVFCLSIVSNYGFADIASVGYVDSVVGALDIPDPQVNSDWNATSGVAQILNKPTIPTITDTYSATSSDGMSGKAVASAISTKVSIPSDGTSGQVLKKQSDGSIAWANDIDTDTTYTAGTGISVSGTTIANTAISQVRSGGSTSSTLVNIWLE